MARKPQSTARKPPQATTAGAKGPPTSGQRASGDASLRRELTAARARIAQLEKQQRELSLRIQSAIATIHKLLES